MWCQRYDRAVTRNIDFNWPSVMTSSIGIGFFQFFSKTSYCLQPFSDVFNEFITKEKTARISIEWEFRYVGVRLGLDWSSAPTWFVTEPKLYLQHEIFTPFRVERLPTHACGLDESGRHGRYAVPMFSAPVTAATAWATPRAAARAASSVFPFETQPETEMVQTVIVNFLQQCRCIMLACCVK